jgi:hypothetical protein
VASLDGGLTPFGRLSDPFPQGITKPPGRNPSYQQILLGQSVTGAQPAIPYASMQQWNFNIQRELGSGFLVDVAYAGSKGTHLPLGSSQQIDQLPDQYLTLGSQLLQ